MSDTDFSIFKNNNSSSAELLANSLGSQNNYLRPRGKLKNILEANDFSKPFIPKKDQTKFLYEIEKYSIEKDFDMDEKILKKDLDEQNKIKVDKRTVCSFFENIFNDSLLLEEDIVYEKEVWNGRDQKNMEISKYDCMWTNFVLFNVYVKIEKTNGEEITKHDLISFKNFIINFILDNNVIMKKNFFTMCFLDLIENQVVQIEQNVLFFKAFDFEHFKHGLLIKELLYYNAIFKLSELDKKVYGGFNIKLILSGKNTNESFSDGMFEYFVIQHQVCTKSDKICSGQKINIPFNHPVSVILFFIYDENCNDNSLNNNFDLENLNIDSISIDIGAGPDNGEKQSSCIYYSDEELIKIDFMDIKLYGICIDPQLKNHSNFISYINGYVDYETIKSINFSRIDRPNIIINHDSDNKYNICICGLCVNVLRYMNGHMSIAFSN